MCKWRVSEEWLVFPFFLMIFWSELPGFRSNFHICRLGVLQNSTILVGGFNHLYESQWEGLSHFFFLENKKCLKPQTSHSIPITSLSISHCPPNLPYIIWSAVCSLFRVSISYLSTNHKSVWMCCKYAQRYNCIKPFSYPQTSWCAKLIRTWCVVSFDATITAMNFLSAKRNRKTHTHTLTSCGQPQKFSDTVFLANCTPMKPPRGLNVYLYGLYCFDISLIRPLRLNWTMI